MCTPDSPPGQDTVYQRVTKGANTENVHVKHIPDADIILRYELPHSTLPPAKCETSDTPTLDIL